MQMGEQEEDIERVAKGRRTIRLRGGWRRLTIMDCVFRHWLRGTSFVGCDGHVAQGLARLSIHKFTNLSG